MKNNSRKTTDFMEIRNLSYKSCAKLLLPGIQFTRNLAPQADSWVHRPLQPAIALK